MSRVLHERDNVDYIKKKNEVGWYAHAAEATMYLKAGNSPLTP